MTEQEKYQPEEALTTPETSGEVENTEHLPSIEDLDNLIRVADGTIATASMSSQEIDELVEKRQKALELLSTTEEFYETGTQFAENYNPFAGKTFELETLVREGLIDEAYKEKLLEFNKKIIELQEIKSLNADTKVRLTELESQKEKIYENLSLLVDEEEEKIDERREKLRNAIFNHYEERAKELKDIIDEIEANPRVIERLRQMEEKQQQETKEREQQTLKEVSQAIQSTSDRQNNAFSRINQLIDTENIEQELLNALESPDRKVFNSIRDRLINAILSGEGEMQLVNDREITPWGDKKYSKGKDFLNSEEITAILEKMAGEGNEKAQQLLKKREAVVKQDDIFRILVGKRYKDKEKKQKMPFWKAFDTRRERDKHRTPEEIKRQQEASKEKQEKLKKILEKGGFRVEVPLERRIPTKTGIRRERYGTRIGAILMTREESKKGTPMWHIIEAANMPEGVNLIGKNSTLDMGQFPYWVRESAKGNFEEEDGNFTKRITTTEATVK